MVFKFQTEKRNYYIITIKAAAENMQVILISNNYYIYLKRYFEIFVTNDFLVYSGGQLL